MVVAVAAGCGNSRSSDDPGEGNRFKRIAVVGASVSAGFGGMSVADAMKGAAPDATVIDAARLDMFQDAPAVGRAEVDKAHDADPDLVIALDFLFWYEYATASPEQRRLRFEAGLAELDKLRAGGVALIVGDVPSYLQASELILPRSMIPSAAELAAFNVRLRAWAADAGRKVVIIPFAKMCEPLLTDGEIEVAPGERVRARELMSIDGLHPNIDGMWYVLTQIDRQVETELGVARDAWKFERPK
jgi:hypothetical protein